MLIFKEAKKFNISLRELNQIVKDFDENLSFEEFAKYLLTEVFQKADLNLNKMVNYSEFKFAYEGD